MVRRHTPFWVFPLVFGVVGPPAGATALFLGVLVGLASRASPPRDAHMSAYAAVGGAFFLWFLFVVFSYFFGFIQAMVASFWAAVTSRLPWAIYFAVTVTAGGAMTAYLPPTGMISSSSAHAAPSSLLAQAAIGAVAAAVCAWLCRQPAWRARPVLP